MAMKVSWLMHSAELGKGSDLNSRHAHRERGHRSERDGGSFSATTTPFSLWRTSLGFWEKYNHDRWCDVGRNFESYGQNVKYWFEMAFGGGGFAISHSLARVFDSC